jgi:hypothetical protein
MPVNRASLAIFGCCLLLGCSGGGSAPPLPVGTQEPVPDPQQPQSDSQNPTPDPQAPDVGSQEPSPNAQDPVPNGSSPLGGEAGASPGDP